MGNQVYANDMEVSCKAADGKSICAFPDVCFTPPQTPATPPGVPIPYPNTGLASDCTDGSTSVKISGQEVMLKNKSYFKKSMGDEAGCAPKKGVDHQQEHGEGLLHLLVDGREDRRRERRSQSRYHHAQSRATAADQHAADALYRHGRVRRSRRVHGDSARATEACKECTPNTCTDECKKKQACILVAKKDAKEKCCKPNTTGDHLIEDHWSGRKAPLFRISSTSPTSPEAPTMARRALLSDRQ